MNDPLSVFTSAILTSIKNGEPNTGLKKEKVRFGYDTLVLSKDKDDSNIYFTKRLLLVKSMTNT